MHSLSRFVSFIPLSLAVLLGHSQAAHASCTPGVSSTGTNTCIGSFALRDNATGSENTALGADAMIGNTTGRYNTAAGFQVMYENFEGDHNSAFGMQSLFHNQGNSNTAIGSFSMHFNRSGANNTATGMELLKQNIEGSSNTAMGSNAMLGNQSGSFNTAVGAGALLLNIEGSNNTASGYRAASSQMGNRNTSFGFQAGYRANASIAGSNNIAVGADAGSAWTTGSNNIAMGSPGVAGDVNTIRIGTPGTQARTFIAGIRGATVARRGASAVLIDATGQLGTVRSSMRYKEDVHPMGNASSPLLELRPVTFRYKLADPDGTKPIQYGLIAEEVEKVMPDLVVRNEDGSVETVAYHILPSLLLNEYQKQNRELLETRAALAAMQSELAALKLAVNRLASAAQPTALAAAAP